MSPEQMKNQNPQNFEHFPTRDRLHSDVLEEKYGPIHAEVLRHDDTKSDTLLDEYAMREVHLTDEHDISRTYALTFLTYEKTDEELYEIDTKIRNGGMIGKTFREYGYEIRKNVIDVSTLPLSDELKKVFQTDEKYAKARISEFYAKKQDGKPKIYGLVMELYTPDFREPTVNLFDIKQVNPSTTILEKNGINKEMIWEHLGETQTASAWREDESAYEKAKKDSLPEVFEWRKRVENYISSKE
ncbi:MAG: hypothetical protein MUD00_02415 [Candidatus Pacebacteria bacterium]|jgi:hypothetical protein|nr:hypothetical protein [Candidatus Paceibacterota bacterium]